MRLKQLPDPTCSIAQALSVVGDAWALLVVRDVAGGSRRFEELERGLHVSRRTLAERLVWLTEAGVLEKKRYQTNPERYEYQLTSSGLGLLPTLIALQDWGSRFVLGDGSVSATTGPTSREARRVHDLIGVRVPEIMLPTADDHVRDVCGDGAWTVLYCFVAAFPPEAMGYPPGWGEIPGAAGCTLESTTYRDRLAGFTDLDVRVHGVSTQRPDQLRALAEYLDLAHPLLSDEDGQLAVALRLPTFRTGGVDRLKRLTLIVDPGRTIRGCLYPITDPAASVSEALELVSSLQRR